MAVYVTTLVAVVLLGALAMLLWRLPRLSDGRFARVSVQFFKLRIDFEVGEPRDRDSLPSDEEDQDARS